jgi:hypothetical protein
LIQAFFRLPAVALLAGRHFGTLLLANGSDETRRRWQRWQSLARCQRRDVDEEWQYISLLPLLFRAAINRQLSWGWNANCNLHGNGLGPAISSLAAAIVSKAEPLAGAAWLGNYEAGGCKRCKSEDVDGRNCMAGELRSSLRGSAPKQRRRRERQAEQAWRGRRRRPRNRMSSAGQSRRAPDPRAARRCPPLPIAAAAQTS